MSSKLILKILFIYFKELESNWETIRDEGLANMDVARGSFVPEDENLRETGDWKQFTLFQRGGWPLNCVTN